MEEEVILRVVFLISIVFFVFTSCGIKGSPLSPEVSENNLLKMSLVETKT